jgi:hypothetical protein
MRKFLISAALVSTVLTAVPAMAQNYGRPGTAQGWIRGTPDRPAVDNLLRQLAQIDRRIQRSLQRRMISPREAISLRREANDIRARLNVRSHNGLTGREFARLQVRVNRLEQRVAIERRDRDRRPY